MATNSTNLNLERPDFGAFTDGWHVPINSNATIIDALFGATVGHTHTGLAGQGPKLDHAGLLNIGSITHAGIDAHISDVNVHSDKRINRIVDSSGSQFGNVENITFAGATVTETSQGIIVVTPDNTSSTTGVSSAPQIWVDNFSNSGDPLSTGCWKVFRNDTNAAQFTATNYQAEMLVSEATQAASGFATNLSVGLVPHGINQRISVNVEDFGPVTTGTNGDQHTLSLLLMSSGLNTSAVLNANRTVQAGLSLRLISTQTAGVTNIRPLLTVQTLTGGVVAYTTPIVLPSGWTNPNGGTTWSNLPADYIKGTHEFSVEEAGNNFIVRYYYNGGLILSKEFTVADTAFHGALVTLRGELGTTDGDPVYGFTGFSTGYTFAAGSDYAFRIGCVAAAGVGELDAPRVVTLPPDSPNGDNTQTGGSTAVCGGAVEWTGLTFPGTIDLDGLGPNAPVQITGIVAATADNGESFSTEGGGVFCDPVTITGGDPSAGVNSNQTNRALITHGADLPLFPFVDVIFTATNSNEIPLSWEDGGVAGAGTYYAAGATLPSSFFQYLNGARAADAGGDLVNVRIDTGTRLPWNASIDMAITPKYQGDGSYVLSRVNTAHIVARAPVIDQAIAYVYDEVSLTWLLVDGSTPVTEGTTVLLAVSGSNLPLGVDFWAADNGFDTTYGLAETVGANGLAISVDSGLQSAGSTLLYSRITQGQLDVNTPPTSAPPTAPVATGSPSGVDVTIDANGAELVYVIFKTSVRAWNAGTPSSLDYALRDTETPLNFTPVSMVAAVDWLPAKPLLSAPQIVGGTDVGNAVAISVTVANPDANAQLEFPTGWDAGSPATLTRDEVIALVGGSVNGDVFSETWTIPSVGGLVIGTTIGSDIVVVARNPDVTSVLPASGLDTDSLVIGTVDGGGTPAPTVVYLSGTLVEDQTTTISVTVTSNTVEPNSTIDFSPAEQVYFTVDAANIVKNAPSGGFEVWDVPVTTKEPVADTLPVAAELIITNLIVPNTGGTGAAIPTAAAPAPTVVDLDLDSVGSNVITWSTTDLTTRRLYVTINDTDLGILSLTIVPTDPGLDLSFGAITAVDGNPTIYQIFVTMANPIAGESFQIQAANLTSGDPLVGLSATVISVTSGVTIGDTSDVFDSALEGHHFSFTLPGNFVPGDASGSNLDVDFRDSGGVTSLLHPSSTLYIDTATTSQITGSGRFNDNIDGTNVYAHVGLIAEAVSVDKQTSTDVGIPATPVVVSSSIAPSTEGSNNVTITIDGTRLAPPAAPTGQTALSYGYAFSSQSGGALANVTPTSETESQLLFAADILPGKAGDIVSLDINFLGGNIQTYDDIETITAAAGGPPVVASWAFDPITTTEVSAGPAATARIKFTGTGLGSNNIDANATFFTIVGEEPVGPPFPVGTVASAPAAGTLPENRSSQVVGLPFSQSDTELVVTFVIPAGYSFTRCRTHFQRPAGHTSGPGEWLQGTLDGTGGGTVNGLAHWGLTFPVARSGSIDSLVPNHDPNSGSTKLDAARSLQSQCGPGTEGNAIVLSVRLNEAQDVPPAVTAMVDPVSGSEFSVDNVTMSTSFVLRIEATVPTPGSGNTYVGSYAPGIPAIVGFKLTATDTPLAACILGANAWSTIANEQDFFIPYI